MSGVCICATHLQGQGIVSILWRLRNRGRSCNRDGEDNQAQHNGSIGGESLVLWMGRILCTCRVGFQSGSFVLKDKKSFGRRWKPRWNVPLYSFQIISFLLWSFMKQYHIYIRFIGEELKKKDICGVRKDTLLHTLYQWMNE